MAKTTKPTHIRNRSLAVVLMASTAFSTSLFAAPGTLSNVPLYLGTSSEPNILFTIDDSGSMDWEVMTRDLMNDGRFTGTQPDGSSPAGSGQVKHRDSQEDGNEDGNPDCDFGTNGQSFFGYIYGVEFGSNTYGDSDWDCNTADDQEWRFRNSDFNPLYFDPNKKYVPWVGVDSNGVPFQNIDVTNAPNNPFAPTETIDLTVHNSDWGGGTIRRTSDRDAAVDPGPDGFRYYTWTDLDGDGLFDDGEETEFKIKDQDAATQQNFANWFSYYRSRELLAKAAYGQIIGAADGVRMGLVTLHDNNNVNTPISSMNSDPSSGNKRALMDALYSIDSSGGTPLRSVTYEGGRYLECDIGNNLFSTCPALAEADGGACQQNFSVVMTDGFYNGSFDFSGGNNKDGDNNTQWDGGVFGDVYGNTLADIAMHFYERDLQSYPDQVPKTAGIDEAEHQHVVTYTVAYGVDGTLTAEQVPPADWPNPGGGDAQKIDDLVHAAYNGRGLYLSAKDPDQLITSLQDAVSDISERTSSFASVAFNTSSLQTDSSVFLALSNSSKWSGHLLSFALDPLNGDVAGTATWDAAEVLDNRNLAFLPDRTILTYNGAAGIPFRWNSLSTGQKNDLRTNPAGGVDSDDIAEARLNYLRGDRTHEGSGYNFRIRDSRLGDIIHSSPVFVGKPELGWPDTAPFPTGGDSYSVFKKTVSRTGVVYVGANDGMLHGFRGSDGQEVLAYIPNNLYSTSATQGLHYLTNPAYGHRYYVDLSPTVSDVYMNGSWHTVLIGGQRSGGRALFALDVTDPSDFSEGSAGNTVLWEFSHPELGYTFSRPTVAMLNNNQWGVIFSNGYNDTGSGEAALFILYLEQGIDGSWAAGDFMRISTGVGTASDRNGLGTPAVVDVDGNGTADRAYAGDLRGNLWAFDLCNESGGACSATGWGVAYKQGTTPKPLFTAASGQPITTTPGVVKHPKETDSPSNQPNLLVMFGTGQYLVESDKTTTTTQSFYSVWDKGTKSLDRNNLLPQTITNNGTARTVTDTDVNYNQQYGCYLDLIDSGERMVVDPVVRGELVFFNSAIPSSQVCGGGGTGWQMSIEYLNCGQPDEVVFDYNRDGELDDGDKVGGESPIGELFDDGLPSAPAVLGNYEYTPGTQTDGTNNPIVKRKIKPLSSSKAGRLSWEELLIQ